MLAGGVAFGGLLLTSCALPGTSAPAGNIGTVHVAGAPAVAAPPTIVVSPSNSAQGVGLDAPVIGHGEHRPPRHRLAQRSRFVESIARVHVGRTGGPGR